jgi:uncharacterized protein YbaP (TraB family)
MHDYGLFVGWFGWFIPHAQRTPSSSHASLKVRSIITFIALSVGLMSSYSAVAQPIWLATKDSVSVRIIGTVHVGDKELPLPSSIQAAISSADLLLFESIEAPISEDAKLKMERNERNRDSITPPIPPLLQKCNADRGLPADYVERTRLWLLMVDCVVFRTVSLGFSVEYGTESSIERFIRLNGLSIKVQGLESIEELSDSLASVDDLSMAVVAGLDKSIEGGNSTIQEIKETIHLLRYGTDADIQTAIDIDEARSEVAKSYWKAVVSDRNMRFHQRVVKLTASSNNIVVAIGLWHTLGSSGLIRLLEQDGFKITRVE